MVKSRSHPITCLCRLRWEAKVKLQPMCNTTLEEDVWSAGGWVAAEHVWTARNISFLLGFDSRILQDLAITCTD